MDPSPYRAPAPPAVPHDSTRVVDPRRAEVHELVHFARYVPHDPDISTLFMDLRRTGVRELVHFAQFVPDDPDISALFVDVQDHPFGRVHEDEGPAALQHARDMDLVDVLAGLGEGAVASHGSAADLWGIELAYRPVPCVTVPRGRRPRAPEGWRVRRLDLPASDVCTTPGAPCTTPVRTLLDFARQLPEAEAVAAVDSALRRRLVTRTRLLRRTSALRGTGAGRLHRVAVLADPRAESVLESLLRVLLVQAGLPRPRSQLVLRDRHGDVVARVDLAFPDARLVVEADGYEFHSERAAYLRDRRRLNDLTLMGWRVLRFGWEDVVGQPERVVAQVRAALAL